LVALVLALQAAARGHAGRKVYRQLLAEQQERQRLRAEREAAALAVIAPWAETFRARSWFLRARRVAPLLQAAWRRAFQRRQAAAVTVQAAARCFLAQQQLRRGRQAAVMIQTAWRGHHVRATHPRRKQLADIRLRLAAAAANAGGCHDCAAVCLLARPVASLGSRDALFLGSLFCIAPVAADSILQVGS
jgi:abnormal spindle-like microcephaly-associated protein